MKIFSKLICLMVFALSAKASCTEFSSYLDFDTGYRWDRISNRATLGGQTVLRSSTQEMKKINSYQIGGKLWLFCNCAFIKGEGHYGWVGEGDYSEGGFFGDIKGNTYDGKIALGNYYHLAKAVWASPTVGYSWDGLNIKAEDIHTQINGVNYNLNDIKVDQRFRGPFIGFDIIYQAYNFDFAFNYELHFANWHGDRIIQGRQYGNSPLFGLTTAFSNKRHVKTVYGQVFNMNLGYTFCNCWRVGLDLKYQFYYGDSGKYRQTKRPILPLVFYAKVDGLRWLSFAATVTLGRNF